MCCVPLGHRNGKSRREWIDPVKRITKAEVDAIIYGENFECLYCLDGENSFKEYDGCTANLSQILHDGKTKVKIAGSRTTGYKMGRQTVVMTAPCVSATILLRLQVAKYI